MAKAVWLKDKAENKVYAAPYFPIGSIYLTVGNYNPSTYFGGTWEKISGGYLWGCNSSINNNLMNASIGHTKSFDTALNVEQMPNHYHWVIGDGRNAHVTLGDSTWGWNNGVIPNSANTAGTHVRTENVGGSKGHSHDIPHIGVWVWKRIA